MVHGHQFNVISLRSLTSCFLILFLIFLNGCSTKRKDGPPPFNVDVSKIPDANPKNEKLAKYGNMSSYRVFGKNYHVLKSAKNYHAQGIASWYGSMFHKRRTSSGERYNMLSMTAAHKTLPLPTYVEVTNLKNNRKVIVKVNDRGPFSGNRLIDLSYVAAKKLGMIGHGTTHVDVKAIDPNIVYQHPELLAQKKSKPKYIASKQPRNSLYLQVGAFKNKLYAEKLKKRLMPMVAALPIQVTNRDASNKLYRVKIGPIKDLATANSLKKKLKSVGLTPKNIKV